METGIKVIDLICPFIKGKVGAFGGAGVGKTVVIMELINNIAKAMEVILFLPELANAREGNDLYQEVSWRHQSRRYFQIKVALVYGLDERLSGARMRSLFLVSLWLNIFVMKWDKMFCFCR